MLQDIRPFHPFTESAYPTVTQAVGVVASTVATPTARGSYSVRVVNSGSQTIFIRLQQAAADAATVASSIPMLAGTVETFFVQQDVVGISVIAAIAGNTAYFTYGTSA